MSKRPRWFQVVIDFLIDNASILATLGTTVYIIVRQSISTTKFTTDDLLTAVLGVLGLLALSELIERHRRLSAISDTTNRTWQLLQKRLAERPSAQAFFKKLPDFDNYVQGAGQIDLCGAVLTSTINRQLSNLREQLNQGSKIRILIVDPSSTALEMAEARSEEPSGRYYRAKLDTTFQDLRYLDQIQLKLGLNAKGSFEVRLLPYAPSFAIYSFDMRRSTAQLLVEVYPHVTGWGETPVFDLLPSRDGKWYEYFVEQFEHMWNRANKWEYKPDMSS